MGDFKCNECSGFRATIKELCQFKERLMSDKGTIDRIWQDIEARATRAMVFTLTLALMSLLCTLFGLVYQSNSKMLSEMVTLKTDVAVIKASLDR